MRRLLGVVLAGLCATACVTDPADDEVGQSEQYVRVCADGPTVAGIDVSKWQGQIDWDAVAADGIEFAFIRVSHGLEIYDEWFEYNWAEAKRVGIIRGVYQYFAPSQDARAQAQFLLDNMGPLEVGDLPPVIDVEQSDGESPATIMTKLHDWSDEVETALGVKPFIYTAKYFWQDGVGAPSDFVDHPLWVANYGVDCPLIADPWPRWTVWQYTSSGSVSGISGNVDRNEFNGTMDDLLALTKQDEAQPDPIPVPDPDPSPDPKPDPQPNSDPGTNPPAITSGCSTTGGNAGTMAALALIGLVALRRRRD